MPPNRGNRARIEPFVGDATCANHRQSLANEVRLPGYERTALDEQRLIDLGFELPPDPVRDVHERRAFGAFPGGTARDLSLAVAGAVRIGRRKPLDAERLHPSRDS